MAAATWAAAVQGPLRCVSAVADMPIWQGQACTTLSSCSAAAATESCGEKGCWECYVTGPVRPCSAALGDHKGHLLVLIRPLMLHTLCHGDRVKLAALAL